MLYPTILVVNKMHATEEFAIYEKAVYYDLGWNVRNCGAINWKKIAESGLDQIYNRYTLRTFTMFAQMMDFKHKLAICLNKQLTFMLFNFLVKGYQIK